VNIWQESYNNVVLLQNSEKMVLLFFLHIVTLVMVVNVASAVVVRFFSRHATSQASVEAIDWIFCAILSGK
jgi:hypothetical protein